MRHLVTAIFLAALLFSLGEMGYLTEALSNLIAFALILVFIAAQLPRNLARAGALRLAAALLLLVAAALLARGDDSLRILAFALVPAALLITHREDSAGRHELAAMVPTVACFLILFTAIRHLPVLWWFTNAAALGFSKVTGRLIGQDYAFGATVSGLRVMTLVAAWGFGRSILAGRIRQSHFPVFLVLLAATAGLVQMFLTLLAIAVQHVIHGFDFLLFNPQVIYLVAAMIPMAWLARRTPPPEIRPFGLGALKPIPLVLVAGILLGLGLSLSPRPGEGGGRVLLLDEGLLNWEIPEFGRYGEHSGGMFGRLPGLLEAQGYEVVKVPRPLDAKALEGARAMVIINLMEFLDAEEKRALWEFVAGGGSLLILGEHTGVKGIRGPFNDVLEPVEIEFEFDSASFWGRGWHDALELFPHPATRGIRAAEDIQIWIGASLGIGPRAKPVIAGRYGYSDIGDASSIERAYLGDRRHNPGELLGDLCLVAEASYGAGKVMVFGDTSPFQNLAMVSSWAFVQRVFQYLTAPPRSAPSITKLAAIAAAVLLLALSRKSLRSFPRVWLVLALGLVAGTLAADSLSAPPAPPGIDLPKALIDLSHGERFDRLTWYEDCVGGLELNLLRNGYCPMLTREFSATLLRDSELLVVIAPAAAFSTSEIEAIRAFVDSGGTLILSTGYEEKDRSEPLLELFGAKLQNVPLAHFEIDALGQVVRFPEAWPLAISSEAAVPVCFHPAFPDPIIAFVPSGKGGALLIGDSQFLLNSNLESLKEWRIGNIMFLRELLATIKSGGFAK
jgi:hypothetical protein